MWFLPLVEIIAIDHASLHFMIESYYYILNLSLGI